MKRHLTLWVKFIKAFYCDLCRPQQKERHYFVTEIHFHDTDTFKRTHVTDRRVSDDELAISFRHDTYIYRITNLSAALKKGGRNGGGINRNDKNSYSTKNFAVEVLEFSNV